MATQSVPQKTRKHTSGPWQSKNEFDWREIIGNVDGGYGDDGSKVRFTSICTIDTEDTPEADRNARLIAAAPELLECCKFFMYSLESALLVRDITKDSQSNWALAMMRFVSDLARAQRVIAKAEGR